MRRPRGRALLTPANFGLVTFLVVLSIGVTILTHLQRLARFGAPSAEGRRWSPGTEIPGFVLTTSVSADGAPGPPADTFDQRDGTIYLWYMYRNAPPGQRLRCEWYRADERIAAATTEARLAGPSGWGVFPFRVSASTPRGIYRAAILDVPPGEHTGGRELVTAGFAVVEQGRPSALRITRLVLAQGIGPDGEPVRTATQFAPSARDIYAVFDFAGATAGDILGCRWTYEGRAIPRAGSTTRLTGARGRGHFVLRNAGGKALPRGTYAVELTQQGRVLATAPFTVSAAK